MVIASSCGMFVYRLVTSIETKITFSTTQVFLYEVDKVCPIFKIRFLRFSNWLEETINKWWDSSAYGAGALGGRCSPPCRKKNSIVRAKLMYRSGKDTVKNILLFNILIYLFSSRISPNLLTDLCTTSRDGCYYSELEHWVLPRGWEW